MLHPKILLNGSSTKTEDSIWAKEDNIKTIDTRGMACPYPSFESVKAMSTLDGETCVDIITDSEESAFKSIPSVCERRKWDFIVFENGQDIWRIRIHK